MHAATPGEQLGQSPFVCTRRTVEFLQGHAASLAKLLTERTAWEQQAQQAHAQAERHKDEYAIESRE